MKALTTALLIAAFVLGACGRKGPPEREPGASVPDISQPVIVNEESEPTKPRSTLF